MTSPSAPRAARLLISTAWLMVPAGALLLAAGVLDLAWWGSADAGRLTTLMADLNDEYGVTPPAMLRNHSAAITLVVLGAAGLAYAILAPLIRRGRRWARSWALGVAFAGFLILLMGIGADASQPIYLRDYYSTLTWMSLGDRLPEVRSLMYPAWYQWFEDAAQAAGALVAFVVVVALGWAAVAHADYFVGFGRASDAAEPDAWAAALARVRDSRPRGPE